LRSWQARGFGEDLAERPGLAEAASELPRLCAIAECEMEKWWCRKILASECPGAQALQAFWYLNEYEALHRAEVELLGGKGGGRFAFLGSGALPVTAILIARDSAETSVACVDCDGEACELAERLIALMGLKDRIAIVDSDAETYPYEPEETIICASLLLGAPAGGSSATRKAPIDSATARPRCRAANSSSGRSRRSAAGASTPAAISRRARRAPILLLLQRMLICYHDSNPIGGV
jgi:hypothetical protein